jgi:hypothetical protein
VEHAFTGAVEFNHFHHVILSDERSEESKDPYSIDEAIAVPRLVACAPRSGGQFKKRWPMQRLEGPLYPVHGNAALPFALE